MEPITLLLLGAGALYLYSKGSAANAATGAATTSSGVQYPYLVKGAPALPTSYNEGYYEAYIRPAMIAANPNVTNPNYQLTAGQAQQYMANYLELQQWLPSVVPKFYSTDQQALQYHWSTYGVPQKYTFLWLYPPKNVNWSGPQVNPNSSGSGNGIFSDILTGAEDVATAAVAFAGTPQLSDTDIELIVTGSAIVKNILPLFANVDNQLVTSISNRLDKALTLYS